MGPSPSRTTVIHHYHTGPSQADLNRIQSQLTQANASHQRQVQSFNTQIQQLRMQGMKKQGEFDATMRRLNAQHQKSMAEQATRMAQERNRMNAQFSAMEKKNQTEMRTMRLEELETRYNAMLDMYQQSLGTYQDRSRVATRLSTEHQDLTSRVRREAARVMQFREEREDEEMLRVVLYSPTGHGKSTLANRLWGDATSERGDKGPFKVGFGALSETSVIKKEIIRSLYKKPLSLVDQPGVDDTEGRDREHANNLVEYLRGIGFIHAIVLVKGFHPPRLDNGYQSMLRALEEMLGEDMWKHVVMVVTAVSRISPEEWVQYSQQLKKSIMRKMNLDSSAISFPIIGVDNWGKPAEFPPKKLAHLINTIVPKFGKFECKSLCSPLEGLKTEAQAKKRELDAALLSRNHSKEYLDRLTRQIRDCEARIIKFKPAFKSRFVSVEKLVSEELKTAEA